ncbi:MAG TPA: hypothetical protein VJI68_01930 [Candidatus Nanoarchaeia archaeon]|nr:hypothetical protein [Candidatus Nanoarchaeia archaeon]
MKYLLFLNKFDINEKTFISKIKHLDNSLIYEEDIVGCLVESKLSANKFLELHEISRVGVLFNSWKTFNFKTIKEDCLNLVKKFNIKIYSIENKFHDKIKISAKSLYRHINPYLKYEGINFSEEGDIIYLEVKKFDDGLKYRLSYSNKALWMKDFSLKVDLSKFAVVLENPALASEIGDFLRLCWIFKLPLYVITDNKTNFEKTLNKAKEETKGIDYTIFQLNIVNKLPSGFVSVGFSKHSISNEKDLKTTLMENKKFALVFGDDKFGLSQELRDKLDFTFRLTPELKKPLRASHALSYVLGIYVSGKI